MPGFFNNQDIRIFTFDILTPDFMKIKDDFHQLIDGIDNEDVLRAYYQLIQHLNNSQTGQLWNKLSADQKEELLMSYDESFDDTNLIAHDQMKRDYSKWLK